jgi:hypothetical protein
MSAERDGRPVERESQCPATAWPVTDPGTDDRGRGRNPRPCRNPALSLPLLLPLALTLALPLVLR